MAQDNTFNIRFNKFYQGASPGAVFSSLTSLGNAGHYSTAQNIDIISNPDIITQGPGLATLTNGTPSGAVTELVNFIMDKAVSDSVTYGIGATKLFKITPTAVTNDGTFPHAITNAADGESCIDFKGKLYYFYNKSSGADCGQYNLSSTFTDAWASGSPTGKAALISAPHPVVAKEDLMLFGNGQYAGLYTSSTDTLEPTKLDFGNNHEVADVVFHANQWWIAVNSGVSGTNRNSSSVYLYEGGATTSVLSDESSVGLQKIGFLYPLNGIIYVAYQDLSYTGGYKIGYIIGRQLKPLGSFTGSLPTFAQKTLYKNTILFISSGLIYSLGSVDDNLPIQISQLADAGYTTAGALASPFGTPMVASYESTDYKLAKFSGYDTACNWKSVIIPLVSGRLLGYIDEVVVLTGTLGANARCDLVLEYNQGSSDSGTAKQITGTGKRRFVFNIGSGSIEDFRVYLNWANGNATNDCPIREIQVIGHWTER